MINTCIRIAACGILLLPAFAANGGDGVSVAQSLAATCANCHGTNGRLPTQEAVPALAGRSADWIRQQLAAFRNYARSSTVMQQIVRGYSEEEIDMIADWLARNGD